LSILPAAGTEELRLTELLSPTIGKVAVKMIGEDLLPNHKGLESLQDHGAGSVALAFGVGSLCFPPVFFVGLVVSLRRKQRLESDVAFRRRQTGLKNAQARLKDLKRALHAGNTREAAETASRLLRDYLGDMLNLGGGALTGAEASVQLRQKGVTVTIAKEVEVLLAELEHSLYGAQAQEGRNGDWDRVLSRMLPRLQRELKTSRRT
jgi:hypothetical protein